MSNTATTTATLADTLTESPQVEPEPLSIGAVLQIVPLRRLWFAQVISILGDFLAVFAVIEVMTFDFHAAPQLVTGLQVAYLLPIAVLGVVSGVFVDRWPYKPTLIISDLIRAGLCLLLLSMHSIWGFYIALASISVVSSFFSPAQGVAVQTLVPEQGLQSANSLLQTAFFIMRILGPFAAGTFVAVFGGAKSCYVADSISFVVSACLIATIPMLARKAGGTNTVSAAPSNRGLGSIIDSIREGTLFIVKRTSIVYVVGALSIAMFVMGCAAPLIAVYVRDDLHAAVKVFTIANVLIGVGMLIGVSALGAITKKFSLPNQVHSGVLGIAAGTLLLAVVPSGTSLYFGSLLIGLGCGGIVVPAQTIIQRETPGALLGRVGSTVMSIIYSAQIAGLLLSGELAGRTGIRQVFTIGGASIVLLAAIGKLWMEENRNIYIDASAANN